MRCAWRDLDLAEELEIAVQYSDWTRASRATHIASSKALEKSKPDQPIMLRSGSFSSWKGREPSTKFIIWLEEAQLGLHKANLR